VTDGQELDVEPSSSSQTPSLIFPNRRRKRPLTQDDRDQIADKRFRQMMEELQKTDKQIAEFTATYKKTSEAQTDFYRIQAETAEAQKNYYTIQAELAAAQLAALKAGPGRRSRP
jgi:hypothetical protein